MSEFQEPLVKLGSLVTIEGIKDQGKVVRIQKGTVTVDFGGRHIPIACKVFEDMLSVTK